MSQNEVRLSFLFAHVSSRTAKDDATRDTAIFILEDSDQPLLQEVIVRTKAARRQARNAGDADLMKFLDEMTTRQFFDALLQTEWAFKEFARALLSQNGKMEIGCSAGMHVIEELAKRGAPAKKPTL